ncbi:MAG: hypothetical protein KTR30_19285 [Saprospiraceae bacterium]|nr:hypothetical protein [Saprospiraceae bacterium]
MKKSKWRSRISWAVATILTCWVILTLWAQINGPGFVQRLPAEDEGARQALVVYDPDPIYNLDEQVCRAYAQGLNEEGWQVVIASVNAARTLPGTFDHYTFCANTYNWAPDLSICNFIENRKDLFQKPVLAITLGSGSTARAQRILEQKILKQQAVLVNSVSYWLMRPNDESRLDESNVEVAKDMAYTLGLQTAKDLLTSTAEYKL